MRNKQVSYLASKLTRLHVSEFSAAGLLLYRRRAAGGETQVLVQQAAGVSDSPGLTKFPGGMRDELDLEPSATALRYFGSVTCDLMTGEPFSQLRSALLQDRIHPEDSMAFWFHPARYALYLLDVSDSNVRERARSEKEEKTAKKEKKTEKHKREKRKTGKESKDSRDEGDQGQTPKEVAADRDLLMALKELDEKSAHGLTWVSLPSIIHHAIHQSCKPKFFPQARVEQPFPLQVEQQVLEPHLRLNPLVADVITTNPLYQHLVALCKPPEKKKTKKQRKRKKGKYDLLPQKLPIVRQNTITRLRTTNSVSHLADGESALG